MKYAALSSKEELTSRKKRCLFLSYRLTQGTRWAPYAIHRCADVWENANVFDPSRWEGDKPKSIPAGAYIPFGAGVRRCIGEHMAVYEILAVIVQLLRSFTFRVAEGVPIEDEMALTLSMSHGLPMHLSRRELSRDTSPSRPREFTAH